MIKENDYCYIKSVIGANRNCPEVGYTLCVMGSINKPCTYVIRDDDYKIFKYIEILINDYNAIIKRMTKSSVYQYITFKNEEDVIKAVDFMNSVLLMKKLVEG